MPTLPELRAAYHAAICETVLWLDKSGLPNCADKKSKASVQLSRLTLDRLESVPCCSQIKPQSAGKNFTKATSDFIDAAFCVGLSHIRPGSWKVEVKSRWGHGGIGRFEQYEHLTKLEEAIAPYPELKATIGGNYIVTPDITVSRWPATMEEINSRSAYLDGHGVGSGSALVDGDHQRPILHASISCKWTMRSDRAQNTRTEALNLIRNRKGSAPHIVAVTFEPLPTRIASIALGTGDVDCTYHSALFELMDAARQSGLKKAISLLDQMVQGRRLKDISALSLDLAA